MLESPLYNQIRMATALPPLGARLFRNQVGQYKLADPRCSFCNTEHPRRVISGLAKGSADLVGWIPIVVTPEMVGRRLAVFTSVEVKAPGAKTEKNHLERQIDWLKAVQESGGFGIFATSDTEAVKALLDLKA